MLSEIQESCVLITPSNKLCDYIKNIQLSEDNIIPYGIECIIDKNKKCFKLKHQINESASKSEDYGLFTSVEEKFILKLKLKNEYTFSDISKQDIKTFFSTEQKQGYLQLSDIIWLNKQLEKERESGRKIYLHELLKDSSLYVPGNEKLVRNSDLEKRCEFLKNQQDNKNYNNVDNGRFKEPAETLARQLKEMNKVLIVVGQFIISVLTGFVFGYLGSELLIGNIDLGIRLLLGIMCALTIALAELYFLAKHLEH